ncbi:DUF465 domain-containing protein [bacterium]|nr:DUF465 domain-containing protein [bacterium]
MEKSDVELLEKYAKDNNELDRLSKEHIELEKKIEELQKVKIKTIAENKKLKELKHAKLVGRDRMEEIFDALRKEEG